MFWFLNLFYKSLETDKAEVAKNSLRYRYQTVLVQFLCVVNPHFFRTTWKISQNVGNFVIQF